jgi:hypothetical protein
MRYIKTGAPRNDVKIETGSTWGKRISLATISADRRINAPASMEAGIRNL